ncbi:MAG: hypothetical protein WAS36_02880 [Candidatus Saccharimonadales bacterium]
MEIVAGVLIGIAIGLVSAGRKRARTKKSQRTTAAPQQSKKGMTKQETDELITVILPTINNDK